MFLKLFGYIDQSYSYLHRSLFYVLISTFLAIFLFYLYLLGGVFLYFKRNIYLTFLPCSLAVKVFS